MKVNKTDHEIVHCCEDLILLFNRTFAKRFNTQLILGKSEPMYLPANSTTAYNQIIFAHGFYSSALHEIAHWCVAGEKRRQQVDYGYWYAPDGRNAQQQADFERVEVKPQALEWVFSTACAKPFRISVDNLSAEQTDSLPFKHAVVQQVRRYCEQGLPERAGQFHKQLCKFYNNCTALVAASFLLTAC